MSGTDERGVADGEENEIVNVTQAGISSASAGATAKGDEKTTSPSAWKPDENLMKMLTDMGISRVAAKKALFYTNNSSAEMAASWIFENPGADLETPLEMEATDERFAADNSTNDVYKMVFVVNSSLEMGIGKIAAQVAHSAIGMHLMLLQDQYKFGDSLMKWLEYGETKIVLKGESTQHLITLEKKALEMGLPTYLVQDAGKTQVPAGSVTVLCIFGRVDIIDQVTGSLRLL